MAQSSEPRPPIGWIRAIVTVVIVMGFAIAVLAYGTNAVLTKIHGKTRGSLVAVATTGFFVVLVGIAWALRQLQRRHVI